MLSAGRPPFPPIPLHGRSTAAPSLLSPSVAARFISPSFCPCGGTIQPVLSVAEWIGPSCAQCPPNAPLTPSFASCASSALLLQLCKAQGALCRLLRKHLPTRGGIRLVSRRRTVSGSIGVVMVGMKFHPS